VPLALDHPNDAIEGALLLSLHGAKDRSDRSTRMAVGNVNSRGVRYPTVRVSIRAERCFPIEAAKGRLGDVNDGTVREVAWQPKYRFDVCACHSLFDPVEVLIGDSRRRLRPNE
jgi:hypothetical protein